MKFDVPKSLPRTLQGDLVLGGAVGVVERGLGGAPLGDAAQIVDRQCCVEPALGAVQAGFGEADQIGRAHV